MRRYPFCGGLSPTAVRMPQGGTYPPHVAEVVRRIGSPDDGAGEHAWLRIVACDARPDIVGRMYRTPLRGGPAHWVRLPAAGREAALRAPHLSDALAV